jgi:hypothetical protein
MLPGLPKYGLYVLQHSGWAWKVSRRSTCLHENLKVPVIDYAQWPITFGTPLGNISTANELEGDYES